MTIRWICYTKLTDKIPSDEVRSRLGLCSIENVLRRGLLPCYGHLQRMDPDTWPRKADKTIVIGSNSRGRRQENMVEMNRWHITGLHGVGHSTPRVNAHVTMK